MRRAMMSGYNNKHNLKNCRRFCVQQSTAVCLWTSGGQQEYMCSKTKAFELHWVREQIEQNMVNRWRNGVSDGVLTYATTSTTYLHQKSTLFFWPITAHLNRKRQIWQTCKRPNCRLFCCISFLGAVLLTWIIIIRHGKDHIRYLNGDSLHNWFYWKHHENNEWIKTHTYSNLQYRSNSQNVDLLMDIY